MDNQTIQIVIDAQNNASEALGEVSSNLGDLQDSLESVKPAFHEMAVIGTASFLGIASVIKETITQASDAQTKHAQLEAVLKSTGNAAGLFAEDLEDQASALQKVTTFADDDILAMQSILLTFTNIKGANFQNATDSILDLATAMGTDLQSAAIQVGKALNDPVQGISALQRVGVSFSDAQKDVIKNLVETGNTAKAQQMILAELNREFGGSAAAKVHTFAGEWQNLTNQITDSLEPIGYEFIADLQKVMAAITPVITAIITWSSEHPKLVETLLAVGAAISAVIALIGIIGTVTIPLVIGAMVLFTTTAGLVIVAITAVIAVVVAVAIAVALNWEKVRSTTIAVYEAVRAKIIEVWEAVRARTLEVIGAVVAWLQAQWTAISTGVQTAMTAIGAFFTAGWDAIKQIWIDEINFIVGLAAMFLDWIFPGWQAQLASMVQMIVQFWQSIQQWFTAGATAVQTQVTGWVATVTAIWNEFLGFLKSAWSLAWNAIKEFFTPIIAALVVAFDALKEGLSTVWKGIVDIFNWAKDTVKPVFDWFSDQVGGLLSKINDVINAAKSIGSTVSNAVGSVVSRGASITGMRAGGGPVSGGSTYLVGENGPELFTPGSAGRITPNTQIGGGGLTVYVTGNTFLGKEGVAQQIGDEIIRQLKLRAKLSY